MIQRFKLYTPARMFYEMEDEDNFSFRPKHEFKTIMESYIDKYKLSREERYVAVGDAGDCVIYDHGIIEQVSDSG